MANAEHLAILEQGVEAFNAWMEAYAEQRTSSGEHLDAFIADLRRADLRDADLRGVFFHFADLSHADLGDADLSGAFLPGANLSKADLTGANLEGAILAEADLSEAEMGVSNLHGADLSKANLRKANLTEARFGETNLDGANLTGANLATDLRGVDLREYDLSECSFMFAKLSGADLRGADLSDTNFWWADLSGADLSGANLLRARLNIEADLSGAKLTRTDLSMADLSGAKLISADLTHADLSQAVLIGTDLTGADLTEAVLERALLVSTTLTGATLSGCRVYGASTWSLDLAEVEDQTNLVITPEDETTVTVDNLEVAQFIYLMLHNEKIRGVIDTVGRKGVLILGRFYEERKAVLDALKERLRDFDLVPMVFDWDKPTRRDLTETVALLANMSRFVVADVTDAKSIPQELAEIVPRLPSVPVRPIMLAGDQGYAMFEHWQGYNTMLPTFEYRDLDHLLGHIEEALIAPIETWEADAANKVDKDAELRAKDAEIEMLRAKLAAKEA